MRAIILVGLTIGLAGCVTATAPDKGPWNIDREYDRILGKPSATAEVTSRSRNARQQSRYPALPQIGSLQLLCFDNAPIVRLVFNHRVGSNRTSTVSYRFDENPGRNADARLLQTFSTIVIEEQSEVAVFVAQLRTSNTLYVRVVSHVDGTSTIEFPVRNAAPAIDAAYQTCPLDSSKPRTAFAPAREQRPFVST